MAGCGPFSALEELGKLTISYVRYSGLAHISRATTRRSHAKAAVLNRPTVSLLSKEAIAFTVGRKRYEGKES
jgi:hypothetical protein